MKSVPGVQDAGIFKVGGQPNLLIQIDRAKAARYGLAAQDINNAIQAAVGGAPITQMILGDRRFDLVVRYPLVDRDNPDVIRKILLPAPDGNMVPLGEVADVSIRDGAFAIYREGGRRYVPIKFSVRGRDLSSTIRDLQGRLEREVKLPTGYEYTWAGEFDSLQKELHRLAVIVPISLIMILGLLYILFLSFRDALIVMAVIPFGMIGGVFSLLLTHTPFSISAAVGFTSVLGLNTLGAVVFLRGVRHSQAEMGEDPGLLARMPGGDASRGHGLHVRCVGLVAGRDFKRHRCAGAAAAGPSCSGWNGHDFVRGTVCHSFAGTPFAGSREESIYRSIDRAGNGESSRITRILVVACFRGVEVEPVCLYLGKPDARAARRP